ncbi:MAG: DUF2007 domain-containing protein [Thermodesulfobacteriota bacterium]
MFCAKCRTEYVEGVTVCADCGVPLVSVLPPEPAESPEYVEFEEILFTFNAGDIATIKSLLDNEDIVYYFLGEFFNYAQPLAQPARLMVRRDQAQEAREILKDLKISYTITGENKKSNDE